MRNPFHYDHLSNSSDFCGRKVEADRFNDPDIRFKKRPSVWRSRLWQSKPNKHVFSELPDNIMHAFADLFACVDSSDVARAIYEAVYSALPFDLDTKVKEISLAFKRASIEVQTIGTGGTKVLPGLESRDFDALLIDALEGAEELCEKHNKTMVIALDEFQRIAEVNDVRIDAILRTSMQRLSRVSFIFTGSQKSILSGMFILKSQPLYGMASSISIQGIEVDLLKSFCEKRLGQAFEKYAFEILYSNARGQTKLILQTCYWLYANVDELNTQSILAVVDSIVEEKDEEYRLVFNGYKSIQKKALKMIGQYEGHQLFKLGHLSCQRGVSCSLEMFFREIISSEKSTYM